MIDRYASPAFRRLWSAKTQYETWLRVELAACAGAASAGVIPAGTAERLDTRLSDGLSVERIEEIEAKVGHDVVAFLLHLEEIGGPEARWLHFGLTSSDIVDTALALRLREAADLLLADLCELLDELTSLAAHHSTTVMLGRTHGRAAETTSFGAVLAGHVMMINRASVTLVVAREEVSVGKLSGAVGTYAHTSRNAEEIALRALGLRPAHSVSQVVTRDRIAAYVTALVRTAVAIECLATNFRLLAQSGVDEMSERRAGAYVGSSAMPGKRNPTQCETLCGLARYLRGFLGPVWESVSLWGQRDISHSSVERHILPDSTSVLSYMLRSATAIVTGLVVDADRMAANVVAHAAEGGREQLMLDRIRAGMTRSDAMAQAKTSGEAVSVGLPPHIRETVRLVLGRG